MVRLPTQTQGPELAAAMRETEGMRAAPAVGVARRSISDMPGPMSDSATMRQGGLAEAGES